ncbi:TolC family protein [Micavibrio aeruginosavorus]|uniref:TolC family protein n=1 Tax=Micavibrio aeruginosavorus TaxID=349221 RepID=UPI003F4ACC47
MARTAAFAVLAGVSGFGFAAGAQAETLQDAMVSALNAHPTVRAAMKSQDYYAEEKQEQRSGFYPELNANGAMGRIYGDNSTSRGLTVERGAGYSWLYEGSVAVRQMIWDGLETSNRVDAADARVRSAGSNVIDVRENLGLRVVLAYLDVLRTKEAVTMITDHNKLIADYRTRIDSMVEQGAADESMAVQAHDIQIQLDSTQVEIEGEFAKAVAEYREVVGQAPADPLIRPDLPSDAVLADVDAAVTMALQEHPALRVADETKEAFARDAEAEKGALYPDFSGELSYLKKDQADIIGGEVVDAKAVVRMDWTFSTGGAELARIRKASSRYAESQARRDEISRNIERQIRTSYAEMQAAKDRLENGRDRVGVTKDLLTTYEKQFEAARVTLLNLLQAENNNFNARLGVVNADYRHLAAQYAVLANMGDLQDAMSIVSAQKDDQKDAQDEAHEDAKAETGAAHE